MNNESKYEQTGKLQFVKRETATHYTIINGKEFPDGSQHFGYYDIEMKDLASYDDLDTLICKYYSSCSRFFLLHCGDSRESQFKALAEMMTEQNWSTMPLSTCIFQSEELPKVGTICLTEILRRLDVTGNHKLLDDEEILKIETAEYEEAEVTYSTVLVKAQDLFRLFSLLNQEENWGDVKSWFDEYTYDDAEALVSEMDRYGIPYERCETGREDRK